MPILDWLDREKDVRTSEQVPYRLLKPVDALSYGDADTGNMLIQGDNLDALKALLPYYAGKVKCIYIDPPYNTGKAFEHYDDNLEHSIWLSLIYPRLELLSEFLSDDGFFCCHIDDAESHYLKVILDEIFGRNNYLSTLYVQVRYAAKTLKQDMSFHKQVEQVLVYRKSKAATPNLPENQSSFEKFKYRIKEIGQGKEETLGGKKVLIFGLGDYEVIEEEGHVDGLKEIWASGSILDGNSSGRFFRDYISKRTDTDKLGSLYKVYGIGDDIYDYRYFTGPKRKGATKGKYYQGVPIDKRETESGQKMPIENFYDLSGAFGNCRHEGGVEFRSGKKPEILLQKILNFFSSKNDLVMDSFLGSGTTAAVAQKMGRRYIGVELGEQAKTHSLVRLKNVVNGDKTGISESIGWQGGGGFKFYRLGESVFDAEGHINKNIRFEHLAAHVWFSETLTALKDKAQTPFLGVHKETAYYLLYNGILGDKRPDGGNVLTSKVLKTLPPHDGPKVIYGESARLGPARLKAESITFKQTPYDVKAR